MNHHLQQQQGQANHAVDDHSKVSRVQSWVTESISERIKFLDNSGHSWTNCRYSAAHSHFTRYAPRMLRILLATDGVACGNATRPRTGRRVRRRPWLGAGGHVVEEHEQRPGDQDGHEGDEMRPVARRTGIGRGVRRVSRLPAAGLASGGSRVWGAASAGAMPRLAGPFLRGRCGRPGPTWGMLRRRYNNSTGQVRRTGSGRARMVPADVGKCEMVGTLSVRRMGTLGGNCRMAGRELSAGGHV
jgi:hypothetical protein